MHILNSIWIFYKKLIIPSMVVSVLIGSFGMTISGSFLIRTVGIGYILLSPLFHYFIYEIRNPGEYYFYYNMGLSKLILWASTFTISSIIGLILVVL
jgi:hypothetical protein